MDPHVPVQATPCTWHICWQAALGRDLFADETLHGRVRTRLLDAHHRHGRTLMDYLLLPSEIHVLAQLPPGDNPGSLSRAIGNVVARWVRAAHPVRSPVFAGPFRAHAITAPDALRHELRMLAWRPVFLGLCATPSHYAHSALRTALGLRPAQGFDARPMLLLFGETVIASRADLRAWLRMRPSERQARQWELACGLALATGSVGPHVAMARELRRPGAASLVAAGGADGIDGALRLLEAWVKARLGVFQGLDLCIARDAVGARGRALVACLAVAHGLCSAASVARHFHRAKATLSEQMVACRQRPEDQLILAVPAQRIAEEALALCTQPHRPGQR